MQIPILIEVIGDRYRAKAGEPFALSAEGDTRLEAYRKLEELILGRLQTGSQLFTLEIREAHPASIHAGSFKDHPLWDEWQAAIAENRRREDAQNP